MNRQQLTKHKQKQANGYWNALPVRGKLCLFSTGSFINRMENMDQHYRLERFFV